MIKKIVGLTLCLVILTAVLAVGTWAYLKDTEKSSDNFVNAGSMDLKTVINTGSYVQSDGFDNWFDTANLKSGDTMPLRQMWVRDQGTVAAQTIDFSFTITSAGNTGTNGSLEHTLKLFRLQQLAYGRNIVLLNTATDTDLNPQIYLVDHGAKGYYDLYDLVQSDTNLSGIPANGDWQYPGPISASPSTDAATGIIDFVMQVSVIDPVPASLVGTFRGNGLNIVIKYSINQQ